MFPQFGPYSQEQAEVVAEEILSSKGLYVALEHLLRGDMTTSVFLYALLALTEEFHQQHFSEEALAAQRRDESANCADEIEERPA